jgi:hypothetical protein
VLGRSTFDFVPARGTAFDMKGHGFSVKFKQDAAGTITNMVVYQPNGTFLAERKYDCWAKL